MARISIIGAGAIGGTVAVRLMEAGRHDVTLCARSPLAKMTVELDGAETTVAPTVHTKFDGLEPVDWVFVATKAHDAESTAAWFKSLVGPRTRIAVLQNGVEHVARFAPYVPADSIVPVVVNIPVERSEPGFFRQRRAGALIVGDDGNGRDFAALFEGSTISVKTTPDFLTEAWRKLAVNCAGAVSALVLKPAGVSRGEAVAEIMAALARECVTVGRLEGAKLDDQVVDQVVKGYQTAAPDSVNSMHADRVAGRQMEIDLRHGVIVRLGRQHGVETPVNRMFVTLLEAAS